MKSKNNPSPKGLTKLDANETQGVVGGAENFLQGKVAQPTSSRLAPVRTGGLSLAQKSVPTIDCWHECTMNISGC